MSKNKEIANKLSDGLRVRIMSFMIRFKREFLTEIGHLEHFKVMELGILFSILEDLRMELGELKDLRSEQGFVIFNDEGELENYEEVKLNYVENYLEGLKSPDLDVIKQSEWFESTAKINSKLLFQKYALNKFNEIQKEYPQDYKVFTEKVNEKINSQQKLKWNADLSDLGYIFRNLSDLGYFDFPKNSRDKHDLKLVGEILLKTFDVKGSLASLKEFMGNEGNKRDRLDTKFENAVSITPENKVFHIPPNSKLN